VTAPCNSPEQAPITFGIVLALPFTISAYFSSNAGCAHAQQLIWMLFNAIDKGFAASGDNDHAFLQGRLYDFLHSRYS